MKQLLLLILLIPTLVFAQAKRDNTIVVAHLHFKEALLRCLDQGYNIASKDDSLQYFTTMPRNDKHHNQIVYHVRIKDSIGIITGELNQNMAMTMWGVTSKFTPQQIEFRGMSDSPMKLSWGTMDDFSKSFGLPVSYVKN